MPAQVPVPLRKERNARLRQALAESARRYQQSFLGQTLPVLWEHAVPIDESTWEVSGLSGNYLRITAESSENLWNHITSVRLKEITGDGLQGNLMI